MRTPILSKVIACVLLLSLNRGDAVMADDCPATGYVMAGTFRAGTLPACVATADLDDDGKIDLAVVNEFSANVSVLLGNGDGTFKGAVHYLTDASPSAVVAGDFNRDGKPDLAVANAGSASVSVLLGNGDGTLQARVGYVVGAIPRSVAVGDFNNDGKLDLVVANRASSDVSALLGNGDGTFQAAVSYLVGVDPLSVAVGDFSGDGSLDLAVANSALFDDPPSVSALLNRGSGTFRNAVNYDAGASPRSVGVGDFNKDGHPDLAVANYGEFIGSQFTNSSVSVLLGNAGGTFQEPVNYRAGEGPVSLVVADYDSNGQSDLAVVNNRSRNVSLLWGRGDGTFSTPDNYGTGFNPRWLATGDFNGDGKLDLTVANDNGALVLLHTCLTNADLSITMADSPDPVAASSNLTYTLIVTNAGPAPAPDASFTDRLPQGMLFVAATASQGSCTQNGGIINCALGNVENAGRATVTITVTPTIAGSATNSATVSSSVTTDQNSTNNSALAVTTVLPLVSIMALDASASEAGPDPGAFRINRTGGNSGALTLNYTVAGSAANGIDYAGLSTSATIPGGSASATITVSPFDELEVEPAETAVLTLVPSPTYAINSASHSAVVSILDDDDYWLSINDVAVGEGNNGATNAVFTVSLSYPNPTPVFVGFSTVNTTASSGSDYLATNGTLRFAPGSTNQTITVPVIGDVLNEANETFSVTLMSPTNGVIAVGQGTGTINNDDPLPSLSISDVIVTEGDSGSTGAVFTVSLSAVSGQTVTVNFASADGTARAGTDYTATNGTLTFPPGTPALTIRVKVNGDLLNEIDEAFVVALSSPGNATLADSQGTGTVNNNDPLPSLSIADAAVTEGNNGTIDAVFMVSLSAVSGQTVTINFASADGTARAGTDYAATNGALTFPPGLAAQTIRVKINGDLLNEIDEAFSVALSSPGNATLADSQGTGTVNNDDPLPRLSVTDAAVTEGNSGTTDADFMVSLSAPSGQAVTVNYTSANGAAIANADYLATSGTLTFAPGSTHQTVTVPVIGDTLNEANEMFLVTLTGPTNAVIADGQGTGTINNDDPLPSLSIGDVIVTEANSDTINAVFIVSLSAVSGQTVTVNFVSADGTARRGSDYGSTNGTLTFAPGSANQAVTVPVIGDLLNEANETFLVTLNSPTNAVIAGGQGTGTINNDDPLPTLSVADTAVTEGNSGTTHAVFTVSLSAVSGQTVTVNHASADGTARAGTDYSATNGVLTFPPGASAQTIRVKVNGDLPNEFDETFVVTLSSPGNATLGDGPGTGTIINDDPLPGLSITDAAVTEGNSGTTGAVFVVSLSAASGKLVSVNYATERGTVVGNDFVSASGVLSFGPGQTQQIISVQANGDTRIEANETFFVNLNNPAEATLADSQGLGTILNDDGVPAVSITDVSVSEGNTGTANAHFTVRLSTPHDQTVTVGYRTADGTAVAGADYVGTNGVLSFASGTTNQMITVAVIGDRLDEIDDTYFVNLLNSTNAFISDSQGLGTILDDDPLNFLLSTDSVSVVEGGTNSFFVRLGSPPTSNVVIRTRLSSGDSDLTVIGADLTFSATNWNVPQPVAIRALEDGDTTDDNAVFTVSSAALPSQTLSVRGLDNDLEQFIRCSGESAVFSTTPSGAGPFSYLWSKEATPLAGQTNSSLLISNAMTGDAGSYSVEIRSASYTVTKIGTLVVNSATSTTPLSGLTQCPGTTAVFGIVAGGTGPFTFVWRKNGTLLPGQTNSSLIITNVKQTDSGTYRVEVTGQCGSAASSATLTLGNSEGCLLRIISVGMVGTGVAIRFTTLPGEHYRLERTADLGRNLWSTVIDSVPGTGETVQVSDAGAGSQPSRFYRVVLLSDNVSPQP